MLAKLRRDTGIETTCLSHLARRPSPKSEQLGYRVIREGIQNVRKHSQAGSVTLELTPQEGHLEVWLSDDGLGFDPHLPFELNRFGLASMHHQVEAVGGSLEVVTAPGRGTTLHAVIPSGLTD